MKEKNIIRVGEISSVNYKRGCADVRFDDDDVKTDLPFFSNEYQMPDLNDLVVVIFQTYRNKEQGFIIGPVFNESHMPKCPGKGNFFKQISEKSFVRYDAKTDTLEVNAGKGNYVKYFSDSSYIKYDAQSDCVEIAAKKVIINGHVFE